MMRLRQLTRSKRPLLRAIIVTSILAAVLFAVLSDPLSKTAPNHSSGTIEQPISTAFNKNVVLDVIQNRCSVCHGCYDAPCQLRMTSPEGIARGASKQAIYNPSRMSEAPLTRLGVDAQTEDEWEKLGFFNVKPAAMTANAQSSLLWQMMALGKQHPVPENAPLPKSVDLDITRQLTCPAPDEFDLYEQNNVFGGMPYATAPLPEAEFTALESWIAAGAPALENEPEDISRVAGQVADWESFLNGDTPKEKLVARYIYEHLFLAHLRFTDNETSFFFSLVRSTTPSGQPIKVIATRRPYDAPGSKDVYYRLQSITDTVLHKTHIVYEAGTDRLQRYRALFLNPDWTTDVLVSYEPEVASNPFIAFAAIPAEHRYNFLLDDPEYFIRTFIRGPVCRGQVAVNVIEDRFWLMFLDPKFDLSVTDQEYLIKAAPFLGLPAAHVNDTTLEHLESKYLDHHRNYAELRAKEYNARDERQYGPSINSIWQGHPKTGSNTLTIFRHFDSASVTGGFIGDIPETAWVVDFPTLERIYYNLVAGFDVFGSLDHQISARLYMDLLRIESEDLFLSYLPADIRRETHKEWYRTSGHIKIRTLLHRDPIDIDYGTQIPFSSNDPKAEFLNLILNRNSILQEKYDPLNRRRDQTEIVDEAISSTISALSRLSSVEAPWVQYLPDLSLLNIRFETDGHQVFSLIHDKAHTNVAYIFGESFRREPRLDTLTILRGQIGSYPNLFFDIDDADLEVFVRDMASVESTSEWQDFVGLYATRRSSPDFWKTADYFQNALRDQDPVSAGLLDLNRYVDP